MSYTGVHKISADGTVKNVGDVRNSSGWCMHIWRSLAADYSVPVRMFEYEPLWEMFGKSPMSERDSIVLGATFDAVWVKHENLSRLIAALESFWTSHSTMVDMDGRTVGVVATIPGVVSLLKDIASDATARGACFYATSTTDDPWYGKPEGEDEDAPRFVFGKDTTTRHGDPFELFEGLASAKGAPS